MSEPVQPQDAAGDGYALDAEELDALPVLDGELSPNGHWPRAELAPARTAALALPAVQAAAMAAGGFVAGAAVAGIVHRRRRRRALIGAKGSRRALRSERGSRRSAATELVQIVGSRSLLVDVHLLGGSGSGSGRG